MAEKFEASKSQPPPPSKPDKAHEPWDKTADKPDKADKDRELTEDEREAEKNKRQEAAEAEARAKIKAAEDEGEVKNLAEKEADKARLEGGEPIKSVAGKPSVADPLDKSPPSQPPAGSPNASATNPALVANNAMPVAPAQSDPKDLAKAEAEGMVPTPLHASGVQPHVG